MRELASVTRTSVAQLCGGLPRVGGAYGEIDGHLTRVTFPSTARKRVERLPNVPQNSRKQAAGSELPEPPTRCRRRATFKILRAVSAKIVEMNRDRVRVGRHVMMN